MKILLYVPFHRNSELVDIIKNDSLLSTKLKFIPDKNNYIITNIIDTDTEEFERFVEIARNDLPINMVPIMKYTAKEMELFNFYELGINSVLRQGAKDAESNKAEFRSTPFLYPTQSSRIRLINKIFMSKVSIRPDTIYCFEQYHEFVFGREVKEIFQKAELTGFGVKPVINTVTKEPYSDYFFFYTESVLPSVHEDITMFDKVLSEGEKRSRENTRCICLLGSEVYDTAGEHFSDFNRTAEGFVAGWSPLWIVSRKVRDIYNANKLKGLLFKPVFETDTPMYEEYINKWSLVLEKVNQNPQIHLER